jgi:hypothetical protein
MNRGASFNILKAINDRGPLTNVAISNAIHCKIDRANATIFVLKKKYGLISQRKKFAPYELTNKGHAELESYGVAIKNSHSEVIKKRMIASKAKKSGAPKNGKVTNGVTKFSKPSSMSGAMFNELVTEYFTAERRAEAIANLFHNWPR